jgi:Family of unknown function (DUF5681)
MSILDTPTPLPSAASEAPAACVDESGLAVGAAAQHVPNLPAEAAPSAAVPTLAIPAAFAVEGVPAAAAATQDAPDLPPAEAAPSAAVPTLARPAVEGAPVVSPTSGSVENFMEKPRGRPFEPGQSGNPYGRPKGSRNRVTRAVEALIDGKGEALGQKAVEMALGGDPTLVRVLLSMLVPTRRERTVEFELPKIESAADALKASSAVIAACAAGELSVDEAKEIMGLIATHVHAIEVAEFEAGFTAFKTRFTALEKRQQP